MNYLKRYNKTVILIEYGKYNYNSFRFYNSDVFRLRIINFVNFYHNETTG